MTFAQKKDFKLIGEAEELKQELLEMMIVMCLGLIN